MRKIVILALAALWPLSMGAQTTMWPYIYPEFGKGTITFTSGKTQEAELNVHLRKGDLHFLDGEKIKCADASGIRFVTIGGDNFISEGGKMLKVAKGELSACVCELLLGDFESLMSGGGAYGTSTSTSATTKISSMDVGGEGLTNIAVLRDGREDGAELPLKKELYLYAGGKLYRASKKDVENALPGSEEEGYHKFIKENKIKWNSPEGLYPLVKFLSDLK